MMYIPNIKDIVKPGCLNVIMFADYNMDHPISWWESIFGCPMEELPSLSGYHSKWEDKTQRALRNSGEHKIFYGFANRRLIRNNNSSLQMMPSKLSMMSSVVFLYDKKELKILKSRWCRNDITIPFEDTVSFAWKHFHH